MPFAQALFHLERHGEALQVLLRSHNIRIYFAPSFITAVMKSDILTYKEFR